jgi:predicted nucleotidyltransferase
MIRSSHSDENRFSSPQTREEIIESLQTHRRELDELGVTHISLFGSAARGDLTPQSDVDMVVEFSQTTYRRFVAVKSFLEAILGREVDLLTPAAIQGRLKEEIEKDLVDVPT